MQQVVNRKPDIKVSKSGKIELYYRAAKKMEIDDSSMIIFFIGEDGELYVRKVAEGGLKKQSKRGLSHYKYRDRETAKIILSHPDIPDDVKEVGFRLGETDDGSVFPVITRRIFIIRRES